MRMRSKRDWGAYDDVDFYEALTKDDSDTRAYYVTVGNMVLSGYDGRRVIHVSQHSCDIYKSNVYYAIRTGGRE